MRDARRVKPKDNIGILFPYIFDRRCDAEVSSTKQFDLEKLCQFVDKFNENSQEEYKMTYFHGILAAFGMVFFNRNCLNRFIKKKRLYERDKIIFSFVAKNKLSDSGEEKLISICLNPECTGIELSRKVAVDVFKVKKSNSNDFDDILNKFTTLPGVILAPIVSFVKFLDKHGLTPRVLTEGDTNYATVIFSNLGSIKAPSCYHHLNEYGTNSIVITIGTIKKVNGKRMVDITFTLDERIADGFYFAKSVNLAQEICNKPELLKEKLSTKVEFEN